MDMGRYAIYAKSRFRKRADDCGIETNSLELAKGRANEIMASPKGIKYKWVRVKDLNSGKYVYEAK